jgi:hypothetical protein
MVNGRVAPPQFTLHACNSSLSAISQPKNVTNSQLKKKKQQTENDLHKNLLFAVCCEVFMQFNAS